MLIALNAAAIHFLATDQPFEFPARRLSAIPGLARPLANLRPFGCIYAHQSHFIAADEKAVPVDNASKSGDLSALAGTKRLVPACVLWPAKGDHDPHQDDSQQPLQSRMALQKLIKLPIQYVPQTHNP